MYMVLVCNHCASLSSKFEKRKMDFTVAVELLLVTGGGIFLREPDSPRAHCFLGTLLKKKTFCS